MKMINKYVAETTEREKLQDMFQLRLDGYTNRLIEIERLVASYDARLTQCEMNSG